MSRPTATSLAELHPYQCDCSTCEPRTSATVLADIGAAGFFVGSSLALLLALAAYPAATDDAVLAVIGVGL